MRILAAKKTKLALVLAGLALAAALSGADIAQAATGSVVYTYDALGRVLTASYDTGIIIIYTYDANGNRTQQVINVNTQTLCWTSTSTGKPTNWGQGLWSNSHPSC